MAKKKYRSKPKIVEAEQWFPGQFVEGVTESIYAEGEHFPGEHHETHSAGYGYVTTIHGQPTKVVAGDWIVTEPDGIHHYPIKPDIFEKNYEEIE
jgi:hypothetical protein